ncbi:MAG: hypothetical protein MJ250_02520 [Alphaproteobacteria bacterium]|nr:hypothetical protein [Alphaproteobacteria bacterium]
MTEKLEKEDNKITELTDNELEDIVGGENGLTKNDIFQQTTQAMLAQANQQDQGVLKLLQ